MATSKAVKHYSELDLPLMVKDNAYCKRSKLKIMKQGILISILMSIVMISIGCKQDQTHQPTNQVNHFEEEKAAILKAINDETKAAFNRDYQGWKEKWVHEQYVTKTYMNFAENSMTETLGWDEVNHFVKTYLEEHPEPVPLPKLVDQIEVRLYENGAWVNYEQLDPEWGLKRETRLMEKVNGQWKIAGMQTIIYGFQDKE